MQRYLNAAAAGLLLFGSETVVESLGSQAKACFAEKRQSLLPHHMAEELFVRVCPCVVTLVYMLWILWDCFLLDRWCITQPN
jgi:hypothetical protein